MKKVYPIKSPNELFATDPAVDSNNMFKIFLAGSIEMDKAIDWQAYITKAIELKAPELKNDVIVYNPRRDNWDSTWKQSKEDKNFVKQVEWELEHIEKANLVVFFLEPGTKSPISLAELGIVGHDSFVMKKKVIVLCPEGFYRKGNVDIIVDWFDMHSAKNMEDLIEQTIISINEFNHGEA